MHIVQLTGLMYNTYTNRRARSTAQIKKKKINKLYFSFVMHLNVLKPIQLNGRNEFTLYFVHSVHCNRFQMEWLNSVTVVDMHHKYTAKDHCQTY